MCSWTLKLLSVKRSALYRNSLQDELRDIQVICNVLSGESCNARCEATASGPPEVKIATHSPCAPTSRNLSSPEFTRAQNCGQVSTPFTWIAPRTQSPITASNSF